MGRFLKGEVEKQLKKQLGGLGQKRGTTMEQCLYLTEIFADVHALLGSGVRGIYESTFW